MTARPRGADAGRAARSWIRHAVAMPIAVAILTVGLFCTVAVVAAAGASQTVQAEAHEHVRSNRDAAVRALVQQTDDLLRTVETFAADAALVDGLREPTASSLNALQGELSMLSQTEASQAFVYDLRGRVVAAHPSQPELIGLGFDYRDWFKGVSRTRQPYVSEGYRTAARGQPMVVGIVAPVLDETGPVGSVNLLWELDSVRSIAEGLRHDDGVTITVTDQAGQPLTGTLVVDERGQPVEAEVSDTTRQALAGKSVSTRSGGRLVATAPVPGIGWTVTASMPTAVALAPIAVLQRSLLVTVGAAVLLVVAFTLLAIRFARRRAADQEILDNERHRLVTLFAVAPVGIVESTPTGAILAANDALAGMLGYTAAELLALQSRDLVHPDSSPALAEVARGLLDGSLNAYTGEWLCRARDGSAVPTLVSMAILRDTQRRPQRVLTFVVDQREQKAAADAVRALADTLAEREAFLSTLLDTMDVAVLACDADGVPTMVNRQVRTLHGLANGSAPVPMSAIRIAYLDGRPMAHSRLPLVRALLEGEVHEVEFLTMADDDRPPRRLIANARRMTGAHGEVIGAVAVAHDVTAVRAAESALRASEDQLQRVFDEGLTGNLLADSGGVIIRVNATLAHLLERRRRDLVGQDLAGLVDDAADQRTIQDIVASGAGSLRAEMSMSSATGQRLRCLVAVSWIAEQDDKHVLLVQVEDITARRDAEHRLTELALHDELTGLPNRRLLLERCDRAFAAARSGRGVNTSVAVLFIDLDGFKPVNDRAGHDAGDQLLISIAQDLTTALRPTDTVARVGGDEFVILLDHNDGLADLRTTADRVRSAVRREVLCDGASVSLSVSASVGIARVDLAEEPDVHPAQLLSRADAAMYRAKGRGRDRHDVFDEDLRERTEARQHHEQTMREGLRDDRLSLVFQPVVDVDSGLVVGAEALSRLRGPDGRLQPTLPAVVAAEVAGLAETLSDRVLQLALEAATTWPEHMSIAVNISARELTGPDLRSRVERALRRHAFDPGRLILEITESSILNAGPAALAELEELRHSGVRVAIDDFGTAYATLANLTTLPVDALKIAASFTAGLPGRRTHTAIVHGIASMAFELDIPCIVEGVETEQQLAAIRGMSVQAQGWLWGRPRGPEHVPAADLQPTLGQGRSNHVPRDGSAR